MTDIDPLRILLIAMMGFMAFAIAAHVAVLLAVGRLRRAFAATDPMQSAFGDVPHVSAAHGAASARGVSAADVIVERLPSGGAIVRRP